MKVSENQTNQRGKGEIRDDANAGEPQRLEPFRFRPEGQAFPAISDDRRSRRQVA